MHDDSVHGDVIYTVFHASVWRPVIGVDFCSWSDTLRDYGVKSRDIPSLYNLEVTPCWTKLGSDYTKYPRVSGCSSSSVELKKRRTELLLHVVFRDQNEPTAAKIFR